jgi:hypothetical protein
MVPFIKLATAVLAGTTSSSSANPAPHATSTGPFEHLMNRAVATNPEPQQEHPPAQAPANHSSPRQRLPQASLNPKGLRSPLPATAVLTSATICTNPEAPAHSEDLPDRPEAKPTIPEVAKSTATDSGALQSLLLAIPVPIPFPSEPAAVSKTEITPVAHHGPSNGPLGGPGLEPTQKQNAVVVTSATRNEINSNSSDLITPNELMMTIKDVERLGHENTPALDTTWQNLEEQGASSSVATELISKSETSSEIPKNESASDPTSNALAVSQTPANTVLDPPAPSGPAPESRGQIIPHLAQDRALTQTSSSNSSPSDNSGNDFPQPLGISVAQQVTTMKKAEKMPKTAALPQQNLPADGALSAGQATLRNSGLEAQPSITSIANVTSMDDSRSLSLEKTHDLVALHALRVSPSGNEPLRVVIEPGGGTRLSLELRFNNGGVEAQAVLHRGDFDYLNHHWSELQQRLEPRGVHLGALECPPHSAGNHHSPRQSTRQQTDEPANRSAFAEFALDGAMDDSPAARRDRSKTYPGWETWA